MARLNDEPFAILLHQARFHVGDTLWLTPLLRQIGRHIPRGQVTVVGPPVAREVLAGNPHVAHLEVFHPDEGDAGERRVLAAVGKGRFDAALFAFARRPESAWLARAAQDWGVPRRINLEYHDPLLDEGTTGPFTCELWFAWGSLPSPRMMLHLLDPLLDQEVEWTDADRRVEVYVTDAEHRRAEQILRDERIGGEPFAVLCPGGHSSPRWPAEKFAELAARLVQQGVHILIEGSSDERELLSEVGRGAGQASGRAGVAVRTDPLGVFAALLARARLLVGNDSAPIHYAEAVGTPTVYFTQREKLVHSRPWGEKHLALFDETDNDVASIEVARVWTAIQAKLREIVSRADPRSWRPTPASTSVWASPCNPFSQALTSWLSKRSRSR
jgi:ADP-heptose:LPS heptosyltransferase